MCGGNTSDAPKWIVGMGGEASVYAEGNVIIPGYACGLGHFWEEGLLYSAMHTIWVDCNGRRFMNEGELPQVVEEVTEGGEEVYSSAAVHSSQGPARGRAMLQLDKPYAYMIFDANHEGVRFYDRLAQFGIAWRADSLEQLSDMTGISAQDLKATIEKYNADYENGNDTVFGTSHETMAPVISAPYYAVKVSPVSVQGNAAVFVDDDMTVLMKNHGERIENLYAAGGAACNSFYNSGTGTHMGTALTSGAYAGENAREAILGK